MANKSVNHATINILMNDDKKINQIEVKEFNTPPWYKPYTLWIAISALLLCVLALFLLIFFSKNTQKNIINYPPPSPPLYIDYKLYIYPPAPK